MMLAACGQALDAGESVVHRVTIAHPGKPKPVACRLVEEKDDTGATSGYSMEVDSVTCADKECEIIPVRLSWDELGNYLRYELNAGDELTKKDHEIFTREDYKTLSRILAEHNSPLRWVEADELVPPEEAILGGVDAVSGATILSKKGTVVKGAAYTCYTLWHWANGGVREEIRRLTGAGLDKERVLEFLGGDDRTRVIFALEQLAERELTDEQVIEAVVGQVGRDDDTVARKALRCLERQVPGSYFQTIERLFVSSAGKRRVMFLQSLAATRAKPPGGFHDRISGWIPELGSYHEVDVMLKLMEACGTPSGKVVKQVMGLLEQENFLVARRAYWFLEERKLTAGQRNRIEEFRVEHEDRL
jgi:hypothetical protein